MIYKPSFNFYESFGDIMECLAPDEQLELFWMIFNYGISGIAPNINHSDKLLRVFHGNIKDRLDRDWTKFCEWQRRKEGNK